jgi:hypothetical protein
VEQHKNPQEGRFVTDLRETMKILTHSKSIIGLMLFLLTVFVLAIKGKIDREVATVLEILAGSFFVSRSVDNFAKAKKEDK